MNEKDAFLRGFNTGYDLAKQTSSVEITGTPMKKTYTKKAKKGKRGGKMTPWTEEEDAILRANLDTKPRFVTQYIPSRTPLAIGARMMLMKKGKLKKKIEQVDKYEGLAKLGQDVE
jgi:hypothetical protein